MPRITAFTCSSLLGAILLGCAAQPSPPVASFRNAKTPIYSTATLPVARLIGTWRQVASFGAAKPCAPSPALTIAPNAAGTVQARYDLCFGTQRNIGAGALASAGAPGRYQIAGIRAPIWVLWIDDDSRSMVLGTPNGTFAMVLSKDAISSDRLRAAREVLAWNGYDLTQFYQY